MKKQKPQSGAFQQHKWKDIKIVFKDGRSESDTMNSKIENEHLMA